MTEDRVFGGDPCPRCRVGLDWDEQQIASGEDYPEWQPFIIHPDPQCGWLPDGYPSTREGRGEAVAPTRPFLETS